MAWIVTGFLALSFCPFNARSQGQAPALPPRFNTITMLTNREASLAVSNAPLELQASSNLVQWSTLATFTPSTPSIQFTDTAAPYILQRFYRAQSVSSTNLSGDHLSTDAGDVVMHPVNHASLVLRWGDKWIYNDPAGSATLYANLPRADLILVGHSHGDHFSTTTIDAVRRTNSILVVPQAVFNSLSTAQRTLAVVLTNGASVDVLGLTVDAVPAYNLTTQNHLRGVGNGYVLTIGGKRLYFSGDTEDIPEMRALRDIDVAFVCMNIPFTMSVEKAASAVREFRPRVVYPYHFRNGDQSFADLNAFKRQVGQDLGIEVRFRKWY